MEIKRDEMFHFIRWMNLIIGLYSIYYYMVGGTWYLLAIGFLNIAIWVFTRKYI